MSSSRLIQSVLPLIVVVAIAVFAYAWSYGFDRVPPMLVQGLQPAVFPRLVVIVILGLAALAAIGDWRNPPQIEEPLPRVFYVTILAGIVFATLVAAGLFMIALMVFTAGLAFLWGERRILVLIGLGLVAPWLTVAFFDTAFAIRFPPGLLLEYFYYG